MITQTFDWTPRNVRERFVSRLPNVPQGRLMYISVNEAVNSKQREQTYEVRLPLH